ncbi:MAG: GyrI-like domain-containing protein [Christensenella sp.]|uniref:GyrI-like domain-containing protein n=1 Tax=Christensenella sp. TaxID=1935934 RepID=UPI002B20EC43|nr:GyrI-like domain-containing protein [Christensenella sp.]MEA5003486.1 GyrI-like domain-containing protein [Christensenella sp.]
MFFILKCKDYGFTLEETAELLQADSNMVAARFAVKYEERKNDIVHRQSTLAKMREDMDLLKKGMDIMNKGTQEVKLIDTKPFELVSVRDVIAIKDFDKLFGRAMKKIAKNGLSCRGGVIAMYHGEEFDPEHTDAEVGAIVPHKSEVSRTIPGGQCAMAAHLGSYTNLGETYGAIVKWIEDNGYGIIGDPYEKYLNNPHEVAEDDLVTEIYFPVAK